MAGIRLWKKVGLPIILAENHGKRLIDQSYKNPITDQTLVYTLFDSSQISAIIFPLTTDFEVIAVKQFRQGIDGVILELPGGNSNEDEDLFKAAHRELEEETGYKAAKLIQLSPKKIWIDPGSVTPYIHPFLALGCEKIGKPKNDKNEDIETIGIPLASWMDMISKGEISDMKTLAITSLVSSRLRDPIHKGGKANGD